DEPEEPAETKAAETAEPSMDFTGVRLLLVDDLDVNREMAKMILGGYGFIIETAENGKIALDMVAASSPGYYQLILMDVQMPVMNGYEATKAIRALPDPVLASIPVIAMTANAFAEDIQNAKEAGMNDHIAKPLDIPEMMKTLERILREPA
ncbi:MAG: response regulator, partial [Schwartzia sp.]|nr:response regulator [Schwartzia sp. (in: firmicutes)]